MTLPGRSLRRALIALPAIELGGTEKHTAVLAQALAEAGVAVTVGIEPRLAGWFGDMLGRPTGVAVRPATLGWQRDTPHERNMEAQDTALAGLLAAARPDLVILPVHWPAFAIGLLQAVIAAGVPTLAIHHLAPREPEPLHWTAGDVVAALPTAPIRWAAVSAPVAARTADLYRLPPAAFTVIPNGVPVPQEEPARRAAARARQRRRLGLPPEAKLVVFAGRLELSKGADLLADIAERLEAGAGATLAALGEGALRHVLSTSKAGRRNGPLRLLGHVHDVPDWLLAADALMLPSRNEGCPLVFLEAAARRCPVIASGDALECYGPAATRLAAIAPAGGIASLTDQATVRLNDPAAARAAVDAAHRCAVEHDEAAMLRRYFSLMRTTIA